MTVGAAGIAVRRRGGSLGGLLAAVAVALLLPSTAFPAPQDLDPEFGASGKVTTDIGARDSGAAVAIDTQGRIVVAGSTGDGSQNDFLVARYKPDGTLDDSFGTGGIATTDFNGRDDRATAMRLDSQGRIVVAGTSTSQTTGPFSLVALARYEPNGRLDSSFGTDGRKLADLDEGDSEVHAMAIDSQGRLVVAGSTYVDNGDALPNYDFVVARLTPSGNLDPAFGTGGKVTTDFGQLYEVAYGLALDAQGRIVAVGESSFETSFFAVARYTPNGTVDPSFGEGFGFGGNTYEDYGRAVTVDGQGRVLAAGGTVRDTGEVDFALVRFANGKLDAGFGGDGTLTTAFAGNASANAVLIDDQGRIVAVGSDGQFALARYGAHGRLDPTFGAGGKVTTSFSRDSGAGAGAAALDSQGRIVAVGNTGNGTTTDLALARYTGLDATAPDVAIEGRKKVRTRHRRARARFRFAAAEPASFRCKVDHGSFHECSTPYRTRKLGIGRHRVKVRAIDGAGNVGTDKKRFRIVEKG